MSLCFSSLISADQLTQNDVREIFELARYYKHRIDGKKPLQKTLDGKIVATLFFEPSTRTRLSFESAAIRLGANTISVESKDSTSLTKKESIEDTAKIVSTYCDIAIVRHGESGGVAKFSQNSSVPVINAGDGSNEHPTQALLDAFTIFEDYKRLDNLNITFCGDVKYSRTITSLISLMSKFGSNNFCFIAKDSFQLPQGKLKEFKDKYPKNNFVLHNPEDVITQIQSCDVLYVTRTQLERLTEDERNIYNGKNIIIDNSIANLMKPNAIIMHPLPRVDEIATEVDCNARARHFHQAKNGLYIRMSLLEKLIICC